MGDLPYTHLRVRDVVLGTEKRIGATILGGVQFAAGEVVALDDLAFRPETKEVLHQQIEKTGNQHPVVEAGVLDKAGAFVAWNPGAKSTARSARKSVEG